MHRMIQLNFKGLPYSLALSTEPTILPGKLFFVGIWPFFLNLTIGVLKSFFMAKMDSAPSKTLGAPKILKLDSCNSDFPKFLLYFGHVENWQLMDEFLKIESLKIEFLK